MIVEILLPASVKLDRWKKSKLYAGAGVKEYWIMDVTNESIEVYLLENDQYGCRGVYTREDTVAVETLKGLKIQVDNLFAATV